MAFLSLFFYQVLPGLMLVAGSLPGPAQKNPAGFPAGIIKKFFR